MTPAATRSGSGAGTPPGNRTDGRPERSTGGPGGTHSEGRRRDGPVRPRRDRQPGRASDRGGATVLLLAIGMVFVLVGGFGAAIGAARLARHQARVGADFGALAGAGQVWRGAEPACATADEFVRANAARLVACQVDGFDVVVTVEVAVTPLPGLRRFATATARAGPVRG
ncbi:Rv3654c family TadE-like protein [Micromonospora sp. NBC_00421]|uniref:Rv3654c family TadE-like protein n=1 Tax=Micromonospora sp. NBC_00421 TaxID=2975976 RepID=UPI002E1F5B3A